MSGIEKNIEKSRNELEEKRQRFLEKADSCEETDVINQLFDEHIVYMQTALRAKKVIENLSQIITSMEELCRE